MDIKLKIIRQARHVPCMGEKRNAHRVSRGNLMEEDHLQDLGIDRKIIRKRILKKRAEKALTRLIWPR